MTCQRLYTTLLIGKAVKDIRILGVFSLNGCEIPGELRLSDDTIRVYLWSTSFINSNSASSIISGVLSDNRHVTLIECSFSPVPSVRSSRRMTTFSVDIIARFVLFAQRHVNDDVTFDSIKFTTNDSNDLFSDRNDITYSHDGDESEQTVSARIHTRRTVFCTKTLVGEVSAVRDLMHGLRRSSEGISIEAKTSIEIGFCSPHKLVEAVSVMVTFIVFCEELAGRPQNVMEVTLSAGGDRFEMYYIAPKYKHPIESSDWAARYFLSFTHDPGEFVSILSKWMDRSDDGWSDARRRFSSSFAKQMSYDADRVVSAANVFDLLPSESVGGPSVISDSVRDAIRRCKEILKSNRVDQDDSLDPCNRALDALSWSTRGSLKQKILHRSSLILGELDTRLPDLNRVIGEAVKCRNHYVHGSNSKVDLERHPAVAIFLVDTLEFIFVFSDLIEAGWKARDWDSARSGFLHRFGLYLNRYKRNLHAFTRIVDGTA